MREKIIEKWIERGYNASAIDTVQNGVVWHGIVIKEENKSMAPVIYLDDLDGQHDLEESVSYVIAVYEKHRDFQFDVNLLKDKEFIMKRIYIGMQKSSSEPLEKRESFLNGIEEYLFIDVSDGVIKVRKNLLNMDMHEVWEQALRNTIENSEIESIQEVLKEVFFDTGLEDELNEGLKLHPMFVISNYNKRYGASAILNRRLLKKIAVQYNTSKVLILPSSVHEMIVIPYNENMDINDFSETVHEVNSCTVAEEEQLTDRAYILKVLDV